MGLQTDKIITGEKESLLSADHCQLSHLQGGAYFGRTGIKENQFDLQDIGVTWNCHRYVFDSYITDIAISSDGKIQTVTTINTSSDAVYLSTNYGNTWSKINVGKALSVIAMSIDGKIQTVGCDDSESVFTSIDGGYNWTEQVLGGGDWKEIAMSSDGKYQTIVGRNTHVYVSNNYGSSWESKDASRHWKSVAMSSNGKIQTASTDNSYLYNSIDYGNNWVAVGSSSSWGSIAMSSDGKIQTTSNIVTDPGPTYTITIYSSIDYGKTWNYGFFISNQYATDAFKLAISADAKIQIIVSPTYIGLLSDYDPIYISTDYGTTWHWHGSADEISNCGGIRMSSDGKVISGIFMFLGERVVATSYATSVNHGNLAIATSAYNQGHYIMGNYHIWVDTSGRLMIKNGAPANDADGTIIGTQT